MTAAAPAAPFIFIVAGEPSGDALGGSLIAALRERAGNGLRIAGIGGERMAEQGVASLVPLRELAVAGIADVAEGTADIAPRPLDGRRLGDAVRRGGHTRQLRLRWRIAHSLRRHRERLP
jgi:lipid-A-disaccharide synthase